jgi:undecaprenyl-diphosphatase
MPLLKISFSRLLAGAILALVLLAGLAIAVNYFGMFRGFDTALLQFFSGIHTPILTKVFLAFSSLGELPFILSATGIFALFLLHKKDFAYFLLFFGSVAGSSAFWFIFKLLIQRPRPEIFPPLTIETSFSFPSGHASFAVIFFGLLAYFAAGGVRTRTARFGILFVWIFLCLAIGISRLYLGVHYPTDVLAGYLSGLFFLCLGIELFESLAQQKSS